MCGDGDGWCSALLHLIGGTSHSKRGVDYGNEVTGIPKTEPILVLELFTTCSSYLMYY